MKLTVGVGDMKASDQAEDELVTYSLGSCLGLTVYDPVLRVGGMVHCMLPLSKMDEKKATERPAMFVDTGVTELLNAVLRMGAQRARLQVRVAGGGNMMDPEKRFNIGERNYTVLRKILWKNNILITAEDVGGTIPRTLHLLLDNGKTLISSNGTVREL